MAHIYNESDIRADYHKLTKLLISKGLHITTMESATSGQIASLITDAEGASAIFKGALITYCNEEKIKAGVSAEIIDKYSVYSKETAVAMAECCRAKYGADIGIGITGTMGNVDPENVAFSKPGKVYFAISTEAETFSYMVEIPAQESRYMYKLAAAKEIYEKLVNHI